MLDYRTVFIDMLNKNVGIVILNSSLNQFLCIYILFKDKEKCYAGQNSWLC